MNPHFGADLLAKTYFHTLSAFRPLPDGSQLPLCSNQPCALSRSAHTSAPNPPDANYVLPESHYRMSLFTRPNLHFQVGDILHISDTFGNSFHATASDSFAYPSHAITIVEVSEVLNAIT